MENREGEMSRKREEFPLDEARGKDSREETEASEAQVFRDRWIRVSADLDNLRKRLARDTETARRQERERILRDFLTVVDDLERALDAPGVQPSQWLEGVEGIRRQVLALLERYDVELLDSIGQPFDPNCHDAISVVHVPEKPQGEIVDVVQKGYLIGGELLRPARVIVNRETDRCP
jgi:molecular chaperone GrpE